MSGQRPAPILYVLNSASTGGANRSLSVLLRGLDRRRFRPLAVAPSPGPFQQTLERLEVPCSLLPCASLARLRASPLGKIKAAARNAFNLARLVELAEGHGVRLIHTNTVFPLGGALAARLVPLPHVWHLREGLDTPQYDLRFGPRASRALLGGLSDQLICISDYVRRVSVPDSAQNRATVIPNALETVPPPRPRGLASPPVVGCVGLLGAKKRTDLFVEAAAALARRIPGVGFVVAGRPTAGEEEVLERCQRRAAALGVAESIRWAGHVADPGTLYQELDLLLHPGVHEAFGRVLIEAMSWGIPVVGVRSGAVAEIVEDGITGRVVDPDDAEALAAAAAAILAAPAEHARMSQAARVRVQERYAPATHVAAVEAVYHGLLG